MTTAAEECRRRNLSRGHRVPEDVMDRMARQWEPVAPEEIPKITPIESNEA